MQILCLGYGHGQVVTEGLRLSAFSTDRFPTCVGGPWLLLRQAELGEVGDLAFDNGWIAVDIALAPFGLREGRIERQRPFVCSLRVLHAPEAKLSDGLQEQGVWKLVGFVKSSYRTLVLSLQRIGETQPIRRP